MIRGLAFVTTLTALAVLVEGVLPYEAHFPTGTYALVGLLGCVVVVAVSKLIGKLGLQEAEPPDDST